MGSTVLMVYLVVYLVVDDGARAIWRVEAAPIGAVATFELERDEATGKWLIRIV